MIVVVNIHVLNIGKKLKQREQFEDNCKREFERLFGEHRVAEPKQKGKVVTRPNGLKVIIRKKEM